MAMIKQDRIELGEGQKLNEAKCKWLMSSQDEDISLIEDSNYFWKQKLKKQFWKLMNFEGDCFFTHIEAEIVVRDYSRDSEQFTILLGFQTIDFHVFHFEFLRFILQSKQKNKILMRKQ